MPPKKSIFLTLDSSSEPWNTLYTNEESDQVIYRVTWDEHFIRPSRATFERFDYDSSSKKSRKSRKSSKGSEDEDSDSDEEDLVYATTNFAELEYKWTGSCKVTIDGETTPAKEFFVADWTALTHSFVGPDGKEYQWIIESMSANTNCQLFAKDSASTPIAQLKLQHFGILNKERPAALEIFPAGQHMMDLIVLSYVWVELVNLRSEVAVPAQRLLRIQGQL